MYHLSATTLKSCIKYTSLIIVLLFFSSPVYSQDLLYKTRYKAWVYDQELSPIILPFGLGALLRSIDRQKKLSSVGGMIELRDSSILLLKQKFLSRDVPVISVEIPSTQIGEIHFRRRGNVAIGLGIGVALTYLSLQAPIITSPEPGLIGLLETLLYVMVVPPLAFIIPTGISSTRHKFVIGRNQETFKKSGNDLVKFSRKKKMKKKAKRKSN